LDPAPGCTRPILYRLRALAQATTDERAAEVDKRRGKKIRRSKDQKKVFQHPLLIF
jgi:hypothetical protein